MKVYIVGPNLLDQSKGSYHVHAEGCADMKKQAKRDPAYRDELYPTDMAIEVQSQEGIVRYVYDNGIMDEGSDDWRDYAGEFYIFPCVCALYEDEPTVAVEVEGEMADDGPRGRDAFLKVVQTLHALAEGEDIEITINDGTEAALKASAALIDAALLDDADAVKAVALSREEDPAKRRRGLRAFLKRNVQ